MNIASPSMVKNPNPANAATNSSSYSAGPDRAVPPDVLPPDVPLGGELVEAGAVVGVEELELELGV
jgi:hypothetical protein